MRKGKRGWRSSPKSFAATWKQGAPWVTKEGGDINRGGHGRSDFEKKKSSSELWEGGRFRVDPKEKLRERVKRGGDPVK